MNQTEDRQDVVAKAIALAKQADEFRGVAITTLLEQREQIDRDLKTLGHNGNHVPHGPGASSGSRPKREGKFDSARFKKMTLAEVGEIVLQEHGTLHGSKIEELAKAGGFKGGTKNFQNYMPIAFKRAGGFVNLGKNTWKLKEAG